MRLAKGPSIHVHKRTTLVEMCITTVFVCIHVVRICVHVSENYNYDSSPPLFSMSCLSMIGTVGQLML